MWPYLCGGTANLKFTQFESAVCDAFGVFLFGGEFVRIVTLLGAYRGVWVSEFNVLGA